MSGVSIPRVRDHLTFFSQLKYFLWRVGLFGSSPVAFKHKSGPCLLVRPDPAGDLVTAYEVFVSTIYLPPWELVPDSVRFTVDIGGNIGLSAAYLGHIFPQTRLAIFEPHPVHLALLRQQLTVNGLATRTEVFPVAVGSKPGSLHLTDNGTCSTISQVGGTGTLPVQVIDWLDWARGQKIDFLKLDAEGAEYPLLLDPRFREIDIRLMVLEWHRNDEFVDGKAILTQRLQELGYQTAPGAETSDRCGLIWARKV